MAAVTVLVVDAGDELSRLLWLPARARDYSVLSACTLAETAAALHEGTDIHVALVTLALGSESGLDVVRHIKQSSPDTEIIVISGTASVASAIASYEEAAFAFLQTPIDLDHLLSAIERAAEHRRMTRANRRLLWELKVITEIGDDLRNSLDQNVLIESALSRLMQVLGALSGGVRVLNRATDSYDDAVLVGPPLVNALMRRTTPRAKRPSDVVLETRGSVNIPDFHSLLDAEIAAQMPVRSAISVPMFAGEELLGTLSIGSGELARFTDQDIRLVSIIANQVAVAVQNARLLVYARTGKTQWEATFDAIADPIAVFNADGRLVRWNTALATSLGRPVATLGNLKCDDVGLCGGRFPNCAAARAASGLPVHTEVTRPDGQIFNVTTTPVSDGPDGAAVVQIAKNVTQEIRSARRLQQMSEEIAATNARLVAALERLKMTQAQLLQAEKLSAIGQLVAGVAHELNNPLTSVIGYAQLVEDELLSTVPDEPQRSAAEVAADVRRIAEESERAARIVRNLLAFARRQTAERAPQDLADLAQRVLALRTYEFHLNSIELVTSFDADLPRVLADAGQVQQALLNLVLNAEQAMRGRAPRRLSVGARFVEESAAVELFVADTGHGIADENLRRIFDPFFTTRDVGEGTGLGLSICYGIVRDHGGQITVRSGVGQGTTFSVLLPARCEAAGRPGSALVAHNDSTDREYVAAALTGWGWQVTVVNTPEAARDAVRTGSFDVGFVEQGFITSDTAAWHAARGARKDTGPVVVMTGMAGDAANGRVDQAEASAALAPPFELRALRSALRAIREEYV